MAGFKAVLREVANECGHRCAACGSESPAVIHHIETNEIPALVTEVCFSGAKGIILLCRGCYLRSRVERWTHAEFLYHKLYPWIRRSSANGAVASTQASHRTERLRQFGEHFFSQKVNTLILGPTLDDLETEYAEALAVGPSCARRVWLRGCWSLAAAIAAHLSSATLARLRSRFS